MQNALVSETVPFLTYTSKRDDKAELSLSIDLLKECANEKSYPIDGLVISYNDIEYGESLGMTGHHPRHSIALNFMMKKQRLLY